MPNEKEYLNLDGLGKVAEKVNKKEPWIFKGTEAEWNALTEAERSAYIMRAFTDKYSEVIYNNTVLNVITQGSDSPVSSDAIYNAFNDIRSDVVYKNNVLDVITQESTNPVTSDAIYLALIDIRSLIPTVTDTVEDSDSVVSGAGIQAALDEVADELEPIDTVTEGSTKAVTSGAVYEALRNIPGGDGSEPPDILEYTDNDTSYHNPASDIDIPAANTFNYSYEVWKNQVPESAKVHFFKLNFTDETFDTVTERYFKSDMSGEYDETKTRVIGIGMWHKGQDDEEVIRLIFPDGHYTLVKNF